jgi:hypothetical protein
MYVCTKGHAVATYTALLCLLAALLCPLGLGRAASGSASQQFFRPDPDNQQYSKVQLSCWPRFDCSQLELQWYQLDWMSLPNVANVAAQAGLQVLVFVSARASPTTPFACLVCCSHCGLPAQKALHTLGWPPDVAQVRCNSTLHSTSCSSHSRQCLKHSSCRSPTQFQNLGRQAKAETQSSSLLLTSLSKRMSHMGHRMMSTII